MPGTSKNYFKHLVVVHGIGNQQSNETVINFANEFIRSMPPEIRKTVEVFNLIPGDYAGRGARPAFITLQWNGDLYTICFSEVYWQPVTKGYLKADGQPPIPIFPWTNSVATRLFSGGPRLRKARSAIANLEKLLGLLRLGATVYKKSGQLVEILDQFLGDVQMYTESDVLRAAVNQRFYQVLENHSEAFRLVRESLNINLDQWEGRGTKEEIYIVAHSEGTVVSYYSMVREAAKASAQDWLPCVKGLVTMGAPLDKHYTIWKNDFRTNCLTGAAPVSKIPWFNFWDRSDPVGQCVKVLQTPNGDADKMFEIHDEGFARYPIPGLAHVGYWTDPAIHQAILKRAMGIGPATAPTVDSLWWGQPWIMEPGDVLAYTGVRIATLAAMLFFLGAVLEPVRGLAVGTMFESLCSTVPLLELAEWAALLVGGLKLWGWMDEHLEGDTGRGRRLRDGIFVVGALALALHADLALKATESIKDWLGYAGGLAASCFVWKLHTVVHRGLVQMWRYTTGWREFHSIPREDTKAPKATAAGAGG